MYIDPTRYTTRPTDDRIPQELAIYDRLEELSIPYVRVDHEHADTIQFCEEVETVLGSKICKNLFLCNRQQTDFYLLMMPGDKPFKTKYLSSQLGCARLSFATPEAMSELIHIQPGAVSPLGLIHDTERVVNLIVDKDLLNSPIYACHPCVNTASVVMSLDTLLSKVIPATGHSYTIVELAAE